MLSVRHYVPGQLITEPGVYSGIPMSVYHGRGLVDGPRISSSGLRKIFKYSPMEYWDESPLNPERKEPEEKEAYILGRATHHAVLGEADFDKQFIVRPSKFKTWQTDDSKAWRAEQELKGLTCLTPNDIELIRGMAGIQPWQKDHKDNGVANFGLAQQGVLNGLIEHSIIWRDAETGVWLCARPDAIPITDGVASDLKTTASIPTPDEVQKTVGWLRYDMQAALIRMGMRIVCNVDLTDCCFVFVKKKRPHEVRDFTMRASHMDAAEADLRAAIRYFARCFEKGEWPGSGGTQSDGMDIGLSPWERKKADERRAFIEMELSAV